MKLPSPIIIVDATNRQWSFDKLEVFTKFLKDEGKFWDDKLALHSKLHSFSANPYLSVFTQITAILDYVKVWRKDIPNWTESEFSNQLKNLNATHLSSFNTKWIWSGHSFINSWIESYNISHAAGEGFIQVIITNSIPNIASYDWLKGYLLAYEFQLQDESSIAQRRSSEVASFEYIKNGLVDQKHSLISEISDFKAEADNIKKTYVEFMRLKGPSQYWNSRASQCREQGIRLSLMLAGTILISVVGFVLLMMAWLSAYTTKLELNTLEGAVIFASIVSLVAFAIKTLSKLTFSAFHLQRDAEEREQLTHLYLALSNDSKVDADSRNIVLQALFSRSDSGLLAGDHSPSMPSIHEAIRAGKNN